MAESNSPLDIVYVSIEDATHELMRPKGLVMDTSKRKVAVALAAEPLLHGLDVAAIHTIDSTRFVIVEVPMTSVSHQRPALWRMADVNSL